MSSAIALLRVDLQFALYIVSENADTLITAIVAVIDVVLHIVQF